MRGARRPMMERVLSMSGSKPRMSAAGSIHHVSWMLWNANAKTATIIAAVMWEMGAMNWRNL